jgi:putative lipoic acid-binding regulatory protein
MNNETLLEFPCEFPIKAMGRNTPEFHVLVRELVEQYTGPLEEHRYQSSLSKNGRFVSITVTVTAQSQEQLDNIYRAITSHDDVLMAL